MNVVSVRGGHLVKPAFRPSEPRPPHWGSLSLERALAVCTAAEVPDPGRGNCAEGILKTAEPKEWSLMFTDPDPGITTCVAPADSTCSTLVNVHLVRATAYFAGCWKYRSFATPSRPRSFCTGETTARFGEQALQCWKGAKNSALPIVAKVMFETVNPVFAIPAPPTPAAPRQPYGRRPRGGRTTAPSSKIRNAKEYRPPVPSARQAGEFVRHPPRWSSGSSLSRKCPGCRQCNAQTRR